MEDFPVLGRQLDEVEDSWLLSGPALVIVIVWGMSQLMEDLPVTLCHCWIICLWMIEVIAVFLHSSSLPRVFRFRLLGLG